MATGIFGRVEVELESARKSPGLSMVDVLEMPEKLREVVRWMIRQGTVPAAEVAHHIGQDQAAVRNLFATLVEKGEMAEFEIKGETAYRVRLAAKRKRDVPGDIWQALGEKVD